MALPTELLPNLVLSQYVDSPNLLSLLNIYCEEPTFKKQLKRLSILDILTRRLAIQLDLVGDWLVLREHCLEF